MIFKHLLEDLARLSAHSYAKTNITGVELQGMDVIFDYDPYKLDQIKEILKEHEETIKSLEEEVKAKDEELDKKDAELTNLTGIIDGINDGDLSLKDLLAENKELKENNVKLRKGLLDWKELFDKQEKVIKTLRARKNTVKLSRDVNTGKLTTEFQGKKYTLEIIEEK
jgi:chromosome segregation ATPase